MKVGCSFVERPVTVDSSDVRKRIAGCGNRRCTGEHKHTRDTLASGQRWLVGRGGVVLSADKTVNPMSLTDCCSRSTGLLPAARQAMINHQFNLESDVTTR